MAQGRGILGLSDELLGRICSQFCPHCVGEDCLGGFGLPASFRGPEYFGTLSALTQVNVRIARQAQLARLHVFCGRQDSLPLLVRTIVECPALAGHIRVVRLGDRDRDCDREQVCVLRELAAPQHVERLKMLAAPEIDSSCDILTVEGEQSLLAPFKQLPPIEDSFFSAPRSVDVVLGVRGDAPPVWVSAEASAAVEPIAKARLNAFILFKLAKNVKSLAILGEWPLALFPEQKTSPKIKIKVKRAKPISTNVVDPGPLPELKELRLDSSNENPHRVSRKCLVDIRKIVGLISHLPNLRALEIRGGHHSLSAEQYLLCQRSMCSITALSLSATSGSALRDIILCCSTSNLKHFRSTIPAGENGTLRYGNDIQSEEIIRILDVHGLAPTLETLHIDTSELALFAADASDIRLTFQTVPTLAPFTSLRQLSISADAIYYPSLYPRILLRDGHTGENEKTGKRLIEFLPRNIESVKITGIYAIYSADVARLAEACQPGGGLSRLRKVTLKGSHGSMINPIGWARYPVPVDEEGEGDSWADSWVDWHEVAEKAEARGGALHADIARLFDAAEVRYEFDMPEFYFERYAGDWDEDPEA